VLNVSERARARARNRNTQQNKIDLMSVVIDNNNSKRALETLEVSEQPAAKKVKKAPKLHPIPMPDPPTLQAGQYTTEQLRAVLNEREFVVITGVLNAAECAEFKQSFYDDYASIYDANDAEKKPLGLNLADVSTLKPEIHPPWKGNGIVNVTGATGLLTLERLRLKRAVCDPFMKYYSVDDPELLASAPDRWSVYTPGNVRSGLKPHIDSNPLHPQRAAEEDVIQGVLIIQKSSTPDQGFVVHPGFANDSGRWAAGEPPAKDEDWRPIPESALGEIGRGWVINPPSGSLILWKGGAVHGNSSGGGKRTGIGRIAAYIAKYPWARMSEDAKKKVELAHVNRVTHGHNLVRPQKQTPGGFWMGPKIKWTFGDARLTNYATVADLPTGLRRPPN